MLKRLGLAFGLSVLCASALAKDDPLPLPLAEQLPVEVQITQHEMAVDVPDYATGMGLQFGLVGALMGAMAENSQSKKGEIAVLPVRNMLVNYDFQQRLVDALQAGLPGSGIATQPVVTVANLPWEARGDLQNMPPRALVIRPRYALDETMSALYVKLQVTLEDRVVRNGTVKTKVAFTRPYTFRSTLAAPVWGQTTPWTAMGAERIALLMDQSVDQAVAILLYDFSAEGRQQWTQKVKGRTDIAGRYVPGRAERRNGDAVWVRAGNKRVQALTAYQTLRSGQSPAYPPAPPQGVAHAPPPPQPRASAPVAAVTSAYVDVAPVAEAPPVAVAVAVAAVPAQASTVHNVAPSMPAAAPTAPRSDFWEKYRPKDAAGTQATTP